MKTEKELDFSFSGLKSAVLQFNAKQTKIKEDVVPADLAFAFQEAALGELIEKSKIAIESHDAKHFVLAGGVAANSRLRELVGQLKERYPDLKITIPPMWCCTDNAAMIAAAGWGRLQSDGPTSLDAGADPNLRLRFS